MQPFKDIGVWALEQAAVGFLRGMSKPLTPCWGCLDGDILRLRQGSGGSPVQYHYSYVENHNENKQDIGRMDMWKVDSP